MAINIMLFILHFVFLYYETHSILMETGCFTSILWKRLATLTSHCMCYTNETYRTDKRALSDSYYSIINLTMQNINLIHCWFWWVLCFIFSTQTIRMWLTFYCYVFYLKSKFGPNHFFSLSLLFNSMNCKRFMASVDHKKSPRLLLHHFGWNSWVEQRK